MFDIDPGNNDGGQPPVERRREPRRRVLFKGKIVYLTSSFSADCTIKDLSPRGARIAVDREAISADPFLIVVRDSVVHPSRTAWQEGGQAGMHFLGAVDLGGKVPLQYRKVQQMWVELMPR